MQSEGHTWTGATEGDLISSSGAVDHTVASQAFKGDTLELQGKKRINNYLYTAGEGILSGIMITMLN